MGPLVPTTVPSRLSVRAWRQVFSTPTSAEGRLSKRMRSNTTLAILHCHRPLVRGPAPALGFHGRVTPAGYGRCVNSRLPDRPNALPISPWCEPTCAHGTGFTGFSSYCDSLTLAIREGLNPAVAAAVAALGW